MHRNCEECRRLDIAVQRSHQFGWRTDVERAEVDRRIMEAEYALAVHRYTQKSA